MDPSLSPDSETTSGDGRPVSELERGDQLALAGQWIEAVATWETALTSSFGDRERARARLAWVAGSVGSDAAPRRWWRGPIATGVIVAVLATGLVLLAESQSQAVSNLLAVAAWVLYVVAAGCGLIYAYQPRPRHTSPPDDVLVTSARQVATAAERGSGTIGAGFGSGR